MKMKMKMISTAMTALLICGAGLVNAQTTENPHKLADQKLRACKAEAVKQNLTGDELRPSC